MSQSRGKLGIMTCNSGKAFADKVVQHIEQIYSKKAIEEEFKYVFSEEIRFANSEIKSVVHEPVRGYDLYIIQLMDDPLSPVSVNDNLMALATSINAAYNSDVESVTAVIPQFPNSRQERRKGRESLTAAMTAQFLEECGANRVLTIDIHAEAIVGFFRKARLDNLHASKELIKYLHANNLVSPNTVVVAPDVGSAETARYYSRELKCDMAMIIKERDYSKTSTVISTRLVGNVKERDILIIDDMIATGGTLIAACRTLKDFGARRIDVAVTFPFFNGQAVQNIDAAWHEGIINTLAGTNAVWRGEEFVKQHEWYREVDVTRLFAEVIYRINHMKSISGLLD